MKRVNVDLASFRAFIFQYLEAGAKNDEVFVLHENGKPVAEVRPLPGILEPRPRPTSDEEAARKAVIAADAFDPLPEDMLDAFEGKGS
jgi:antitoxin (DNA-binding transcriptional repressor) of toxin-antitoxin stability system